jgi:glycine C-acetyltransferase
MAALDLAAQSNAGREALTRNTTMFRSLMTQAGFDLLPGTHPITPVMFPGEDGARTAAAVADAMLEDGIYVIAFTYPVVPQGKARIRVQLSAAHSEDDVRRCVDAFVSASVKVQARAGSRAGDHEGEPSRKWRDSRRGWAMLQPKAAQR